MGEVNISKKRKVMNNLLQELFTEQQEMNKKISNLTAFIASDEFHKIPFPQQLLLKIQQKSMIAYSECL